MRTLAFASRNTKEILRDVLTLIFGVTFPLILLLLLSIINSSIPKEANMVLFNINNLAPGVVVFGLNFLSLFSAMLISKDRVSGFIIRMYISPLKSSNYILGYTVPILPMAIVQGIICYIVALLLGLDFSLNILLAIVINIPTAILFIGIGLLCGSIFNDKQVGVICGAVLTNFSAWLSSTWFDVTLVGGAFEKIANALPFVHAVNAGRAALAGNYGGIMQELWWVIGYAVVIMAAAIIVFNFKIKTYK